MPLDSIGVPNAQLKLNGYYYQEKSEEAYTYYRNSYGGYSQDSSKAFLQTRILPITLFKNGSVNKHGSFSGMQDNLGFEFSQCNLTDNNTLSSAFKHFECYLTNPPKSRASFITKKAQIWGQGVFKIDGNTIVIQTFYNVMGNYNLFEERGTIVNDSVFKLTTARDYRTDQTKSIKKTYRFKAYKNMPNIESYILSHPTKFN